MNTITLTNEEMELVNGGNPNSAMANNATIGTAAGATTGAVVWGVVKAGALVAGVGFSTPFLAAAAVGGIVGGGIGLAITFFYY